MKTTRYLEGQLKADLQKKMVILAGPRQVGKTSLSKMIAPKASLYLNYDITLNRRRILTGEFGPEKLWILDEIHKYKKWKNLLKGLYDEHHEHHQILVTGSARLDLMRKSGDSLQGRYHYLRLHPLSAVELKMKTQKDLMNLYELGGFPEPFFHSSKQEADRWSNEYQARLIKDEIRDLEKISDLGLFEQLAYRLPECVASPLSYNSLREDLQINFATVKRWIDILEKFYSLFRLPIFGSPKIKAVKKEQKHYHYDWNIVENEGAKFECMIAVHLQKYANYLEDTQGKKVELRFFRDIEGRETDFILVEKTKPILAVECKLSDEDVSKSLFYFKNKFPEVPCWQIHLKGKKDYVSKSSIRVAPAIELLKTLV
jgi:predicted AAA+ superfamily ATPase